jgi:SAM-dependent methyltransferase
MKESIWMLKHYRDFFSLKKKSTQWKTSLSNWQRFWKSYTSYVNLASPEQVPHIENLYPCLGEDTSETIIEPTYFYQDLWAFERILKQHPTHHVDVGSHHKFVAFLSKVIPVTMVDIRPLSLPLQSLNFQEGSILNLPFETGSIESLSSLCVVEHIGLGRYGDPIDPDGSERAIRELCRILSKTGRMYLSVPIGGKDITAFNAGRIFSLTSLRAMLEPLVIIDSMFIVGSSLQKEYKDLGRFRTTGLFEIGYRVEQ